MSITIREAVPAEAEAIWQVTYDAYLPHRDRLHPPSGVFRETVDDVRRAVEEGVVFVALRGGAVVGVARTEPARDPDAVYCGRVAVHPAEQRRGIGTALMRRVERHAQEAGLAAVVLGVRLELPENIGFYAQLGYRVIGEETHPGYTTPTFVRMRKDLPGPTTPALPASGRSASE